MSRRLEGEHRLTLTTIEGESVSLRISGNMARILLGEDFYDRVARHQYANEREVEAPTPIGVYVKLP